MIRIPFKKRQANFSSETTAAAFLVKFDFNYDFAIFFPVIGTDWLHLLRDIVIILYYDVMDYCDWKECSCRARKTHINLVPRRKHCIFFSRKLSIINNLKERLHFFSQFFFRVCK